MTPLYLLTQQVEKAIKQIFKNLTRFPEQFHYHAAHVDAVKAITSLREFAEAMRCEGASQCEEFQKELQYLHAAIESNRNREGVCEIDDAAVVSVSDEGGAYVQAWVWVPDSEIE